MHETNPANGLVVDTTSGHAPASIAAVGLGLTAYPVAVERGLISRVDAAQRTLTTLRFFWGSKQGPEPDATGYRGFYYHFLDMHTGARVWRCELSTLSTETSGSGEFEFEHGAAFAEHIKAFAPTFAKVLVRYNPEGDAALNRRQTARLKQLSEYCRGAGQLFMFELLVPATPAQLDRVQGQQAAYDLRLRPELMLETAASVPAFIGFAVGRTTFWEPVADYLAQRVTREGAVSGIARRFHNWAAIFERRQP